MNNYEDIAGDDDFYLTQITEINRYETTKKTLVRLINRVYVVL
jgi:hypothetical protein